MTHQPQVQFGRVPSKVIATGAVAGMLGSDAKVYLVIASHSDRHWRARLSLDRLARLTKLRRQTVIKAIGRLESRQLIAVTRSVGRGHTNEYEIITNGHAELTVSGIETACPEKRNGHLEETVCEGETVNSDTTNRQPADSETVASETRNGQLGLTPTEWNSEKTESNNSADAAGRIGKGEDQDGQTEVSNYLAELGIRDPARADIAGLPGITVGIVKRIVARLPLDARTGLKINTIRDDAPRLIENDQRRALNHRELDQLREVVVEKILDTLSPEERERHAEQVHRKYDLPNGEASLRDAIADHFSVYGNKGHWTPDQRSASEELRALKR